MSSVGERAWLYETVGAHAGLHRAGEDPQPWRGELQRCLDSGQWTAPMVQPG